MIFVGKLIAIALMATLVALYLIDRARRVDRSAERLDLLLDTEKEGSQ